MSQNPPADTGTVEAPESQLVSVRVPLNDAADAFSTPDESGRVPIVVMTRRQNRINSRLLLIALIILVSGFVWEILQGSAIILIGAILLGVVFVGLAVYRSFLVRIPEGTQALLIQGGKYTKALESGVFFLPPYVLVAYLVTRRAIPFQVVVNEAPTRDDVRVTIDVLATFTIAQPYRFVFNISASDFDQVFQAACQNTLRAMIRQIGSDEINSLTRLDTTSLREELNVASESYGVKILTLNILAAHPPLEFQQSQEAKRLAVLQRAEQEERQALALQRQANANELAQREVAARVERERTELQTQVQQAELRKHINELEANAERERLEQLQLRLQTYPLAVQYETQSQQLEIARGLATNTHAVLQIGEANDIARAFLMRNVMQTNNPTVDILNNNGSVESASDSTAPEKR